MTRSRRLLLDSGVWIAAGSPEEPFTSTARMMVEDARRPTAALDLTLYEVANVIGASRGEIGEAATLCRSIEVRCEEVLVRVDSRLMEETIEIAVEYGLTSYDSAYVAVARRYDWQLVSTDLRDLVSKGLAITPDAAV
jgi:predicted nucleic acid-binding protein